MSHHILIKKIGISGLDNTSERRQKLLENRDLRPIHLCQCERTARKYKVQIN